MHLEKVPNEKKKKKKKTTIIINFSCPFEYVRNSAKNFYFR